VRSRVLFRSDRGHYRRREAPDPQRLQRGRGFVDVKAARHSRKLAAKFVDANKRRFGLRDGRRRSCRALPDAPAPPKLRDRVRGWDLEFESGLLQRGVRNEPLIDAHHLRGTCVTVKVPWAPQPFATSRALRRRRSFPKSANRRPFCPLLACRRRARRSRRRGRHPRHCAQVLYRGGQLVPARAKWADLGGEDQVLRVAARPGLVSAWRAAPQ
jgi:hypothetical protein